ncbi:MAG TPA: hypothetical protein VHE09_02015 [Rhizomicrobium sp.]|nr:hypothetical protein [Rhizomicrobium sp.]
MPRSAVSPEDKPNPISIVSRRRLNRARSAPTAVRAEPKTLCERMVQRRLELRFTQAMVASKVRLQSKSGPRSHEERLLSRNAYAMYEPGKTEPKLKQIEQIATAMGVSAGWLAFGETQAGDNGKPFANSAFPISINLVISVINTSEESEGGKANAKKGGGSLRRLG